MVSGYNVGDDMRYHKKGGGMGLGDSSISPLSEAIEGLCSPDASSPSVLFTSDLSLNTPQAIQPPTLKRPEFQTNLILVAAFFGGEWGLYDITDPSAIVKHGETGLDDATAPALDPQNNVAIVGDGGGSYRIYDVSDPTAPVQTDTFATRSAPFTSGASSIADVTREVAFLPNLNGGVFGLDYSNPNSVSETSFASGPNEARVTYFVGDILCLGSGGNNTGFYDVSDVNNITEFTTIGGMTPNDVNSLRGDFFYAVGAGDNEIRVYDTRNTGAISQVDTLAFSTPRGCDTFTLDGNDFLAVGGDDFGIIDINDPTNISVLGTVAGHGGGYTAFDPRTNLKYTVRPNATDELGIIC